jgi:hypothetical protein
MESSLHEVWESAAGNPFVPVIGKDSQFTVGLSLLVVGTLLAGFFGLSELTIRLLRHIHSNSVEDRSLINIPLIGLPASLAIGYVPPRKVPSDQFLIESSFGAVYMICAVGVYV